MVKLCSLHFNIVYLVILVINSCSLSVFLKADSRKFSFHVYTRAYVTLYEILVVYEIYTRKEVESFSYLNGGKRGGTKNRGCAVLSLVSFKLKMLSKVLTFKSDRNSTETSTESFSARNFGWKLLRNLRETKGKWFINFHLAMHKVIVYKVLFFFLIYEY